MKQLKGIIPALFTPFDAEEQVDLTALAKLVHFHLDAGVGVEIEIETRSLEEVREAVEAGAELVLLDNFTPGQLREAVRLVAGRAQLEASGGITIDNIEEVAASGVDRISVGALTHSAPSLDLSMLILPLSG